MCVEEESSFGEKNQIQGLKDKKIEVSNMNCIRKYGEQTERN